MTKKKDRAELLRNFVTAALELMKRRLSDLPADAAFALNAAQNAGGDIVLIFNPGAGNIIAALHSPHPDADPIPLFRIAIPFPEAASH